MESYGFQHHLHNMGDQNSVRLSAGTASDADTSFDSGFLSSPTKSGNFTAISSNTRSANLAHHSPLKIAGASGAGELIGRAGWSEEMQLGTGVSDDWDRHFIDNFEENLFGFDAADLNNMLDGILRSPFKSPQNSPFKSPRNSRSAVAGMGFSPFKTLSTSNVMLAGPKRSPLRFGGSPFKSPYSSPSPGKSGLNPYTRTSPLTRQRRLILQSPAHKPAAATTVSDPFPELPELLADIKEDIAEDDDLGVVPFQRHNSFGFVPQGEMPPSPPPFSESFTGLPVFGDAPEQQPQQPPALLEIHQENNMTQIAPKRGTRKRTPSKQAVLPRKTSTPGKSSITKHSQVVTTLHSKDALRFVRASFKEILNRATEDAILKEKNSKKKATLRKPAQYPEITSVLSKPGQRRAGGTEDVELDAVQSYARAQGPRGGKRRQEIRPKSDLHWQKNEPVRIAPKKRKR